MTNTKTQRPKEKQVPDALLIAGEIHTLAHLIYRELATTQPWLASSSTPSVFSEPRHWPPFPTETPASTWGGLGPWAL